MPEVLEELEFDHPEIFKELQFIEESRSALPDTSLSKGFGEFQDSTDSTLIRAMEQWEEKQIEDAIISKLGTTVTFKMMRLVNRAYCFAMPSNIKLYIFSIILNARDPCTS